MKLGRNPLVAAARGGEAKPWRFVQRLTQQLGAIWSRGGAPVINPDSQQVLQCDLWVLLPAFEDAREVFHV